VRLTYIAGLLLAHVDPAVPKPFFVMLVITCPYALPPNLAQVKNTALDRYDLTNQGINCSSIVSTLASLTALHGDQYFRVPGHGHMIGI
jgi:hypothetical protein